MLITDYYFFEKLTDQKSKYRRDAVVSTHSYLPLEQLRNKQGKLFVYLTGLPDSFNSTIKRKAELAITKTHNLSSIIMPDAGSGLGFGDLKGTNDALLFRVTPDLTAIEVYVCRGLKYQKQNLFMQLAAGELDEEIAAIEAKATAEQ